MKKLISNSEFDNKNSAHLTIETKFKYLLNSDLLRLENHLLKSLQNMRVDLGRNKEVNK